MAVEPPDRLFTVDEYYRMAEAGIFRRDERVELVGGRIVQMNAIGSPHAWCVNRCNGLFARWDDVVVCVQNPVRLDGRSEPEPDLVLVPPGTPTDRHPTPPDILLVVEVSDTSLAYDRGVKAPLYARAGIPEYWIVDLGGDRVEVYRDPTAGGYRLVQVVGRGQTLHPHFSPDREITVDAILGPVRQDR